MRILDRAARWHSGDSLFACVLPMIFVCVMMIRYRSSVVASLACFSIAYNPSHGDSFRSSHEHFEFSSADLIRRTLLAQSIGRIKPCVWIPVCIRPAMLDPSYYGDPLDRQQPTSVLLPWLLRPLRCLVPFSLCRCCC